MEPLDTQTASTVLDYVIPLASVIVGFISGIAAAWVSARSARTADLKREQRDIAGRILGLWGAPASDMARLRDDSSHLRTSVTLLGLQLRDTAARQACLDLAAAAEQGAGDDELAAQWVAAMKRVGAVARGEDNPTPGGVPPDPGHAAARKTASQEAGDGYAQP